MGLIKFLNYGVVLIIFGFILWISSDLDKEIKEQPSKLLFLIPIIGLLIYSAWRLLSH